jgi:hypothetical protein
VFRIRNALFLQRNMARKAVQNIVKKQGIRDAIVARAIYSRAAVIKYCRTIIRRGLMRIPGQTVLAALGILLCACTHTSNKVAEQAPINWTAEAGKRVILLDPDVELSALTAGGLPEARADWTKTAKDFIKRDVAETFNKKGIQTAAVESVSDPREVQLIKLHGAVGNSMLVNAVMPLPTKKKGFDWTLGPGVQAMREHYKGDYALFIFVRDSYTTAGRAMVMLGAAMLGVGVQGGQQIGFASLVDLRTGQIVWFNRLQSSNGDLKTEQGAARTVANLLDGLPL